VLPDRVAHESCDRGRVTKDFDAGPSHRSYVNSFEEKITVLLLAKVSYSIRAVVLDHSVDLTG
jgi:hypothetical protein